MDSTASSPVHYNPELLYLWKVQHSKREGYYRTYSMETPEGDSLEVDYNHARSMVHITLTLEAEHGRQYIAVIKSGTILRERDFTSARPVDLTRRMQPFAPFFSFLRDEGLLRSIGGTYGIDTAPAALDGPRRFPRLHSFEVPGLWERLVRYLERKRNQEQQWRPWHERALRRAPAELADLAVGGLLLGLFAGGWLGIVELAGYCGFWGILSGALDWLVRGRSPFLPKVAGLMAVSFVAVYVQIQYRVWSIFL